MCKTPNPRKIDKCMQNLIWFLKKQGIKTLACCCGHGRYPMTIVVEWKNIKGYFVDLVSGCSIPRKKKFHRKDKPGYYYIPETLEYWGLTPSTAKSPRHK